jgi:exonuclease III
MLLLSFNVAAWPTLLELLPGKDAQKWFEGHGADVVCLQEVKVAPERLSGGSEELGADLSRYDSFWAPCRDDASKGFQGVATWARKGLTLRADAAPLGCAEVDAQGRCLATEHRNFVLFNVYAPAGSNSGGVQGRMRFYRLLRRAMAAWRRSTRKPVVLCGDLNVVTHKRDTSPFRLSVPVGRLLAREVACPCRTDAQGGQCCPMFDTLRSAWPLVRRALATRQARVERTTSSRTKDTRDRYRLVVATGPGGATTVELGQLHDSAEAALQSYDLEPVFWDDPEGGRELCYRADAVSAGELLELLDKVAGTPAPGSSIATLAVDVGELPGGLPLQRVVQEGLLGEDGMVDTFRHSFPNALGRFTCWSQYTNNRYSNSGARIDLFLVDRALLAAVRSSTGLRCGCGAPREHAGGGAEGLAAALCAATAGGRFTPAPFGGGGIGDVTVQAINTQFGPPHTGMCYTPPKYSDHIAISLLLDDAALSEMLGPGATFRDCVLADDKATKHAQPHKKQRKIDNYFAKPKVAPLAAAAAEAGAPVGTLATVTPTPTLAHSHSPTTATASPVPVLLSVSPPTWLAGGNAEAERKRVAPPEHDVGEPKSRKVVNIVDSPSDDEDAQFLVVADAVEVAQAQQPAAIRAALSPGTAPAAPAAPAARRATTTAARAKPAAKRKPQVEAALKGNASLRSMFAAQVSKAGRRACAQCASAGTASCAACAVPP